MESTFRDRAVLLGDTLVLADLHLGRGATSPVEAPVGDGADVLDRVEGLLDAFDPATVVLGGDVLHAFDTVPTGVREDLDDLRQLLDAQTDPVVVTGNHDTMLDTLWDGPTTDYHRLDDDTVVVHGHERPGVDAGRFVLGHDHPAIEIEGRRYPCFLQGPGGPCLAELLVLPAFNRLAAGVPINTMSGADFQSPLLEDEGPLAPIVRDEDGEETLRFPPLSELQHRL